MIMSVLEIAIILIKFVTLSLVLLSAGGVIFYNIYYFELIKARQFIKQTLFNWTIAAFIISVIYFSIDAARFAGSFDGIFDFELQKMILLSHLGVAKLISILGLVTVICSYKLKPNSRKIIATIGVSLIAFSFTYTGHTAENSYRLFLAPLLTLHLFVVLFWFGALVPLYLTIKFESHQLAGQIVNDFSKKATILVPLIFIAGVVMSVIIMDGMNFLSHTYGLILLLKITVFCILMLIAALNKWRLGPDLEMGKPDAARNLQRAILTEILLIVLIIAATAVLTAYFSPVTS